MLAGLLTVLSLVAALSGDSPRAAQAQGRAEVAIINGAFLPASILIQAGDTVSWTNIGTISHTVTASDGLTFQRLLGQATAYRFNPEVGHLLVRGEAGVLDLQPTLTGVVWQWQETLSNTGEVTMRPADPTHYTVQFLPEGTLAIRADCNHARGTYTVTGAQLDLQVGGVTRVGCPPGSLMDPYLNQLDRVVSHTMQQALSLALAGGGVMQFIPVFVEPESATPAP
jgi:heat shock protein HslJ